MRELKVRPQSEWVERPGENPIEGVESYSKYLRLIYRRAGIPLRELKGELCGDSGGKVQENPIEGVERCIRSRSPIRDQAIGNPIEGVERRMP